VTEDYEREERTSFSTTGADGSHLASSCPDGELRVRVDGWLHVGVNCLATLRRHDVEQPRNPAKSVTVE
jgi:hypothetical protein